MNLETARPTTSAIYRQRIQKAIDYIKANLDGVIRLDDLALVSHFSAYHFHRIFHAILGETVNDYVTRKRMERAVYRLLEEPFKTVTEVAVDGWVFLQREFCQSFQDVFWN